MVRNATSIPAKRKSVARKLLDEHAELIISDPKALDNARAALAGSERPIAFEVDPYRAVQGAHAIAVLTEWEDYRRLDYQKIFDAMTKPAFVFDGRNILDHKRLFEIGFNVFPIGKPGLSHFK